MLRRAMSEALRTPEEALEGLPDFPFAAHYRELDGLRMAGRQSPRPIEDARHFLQEDQGPLISWLTADWLLAR